MTDKIRLYAAPMEGLTGFVWRKAHAEAFGGADKYFTPFIVANQTGKFKTKEKRDIGQGETNIVPQILTDKAEHFIWAANKLADMGYREINLNLGCPSATVVNRFKGAGILRDTAKMDAMLDQIYKNLSGIDISIKCRSGFESGEEWPQLLSVFEKYPISELILHPRFRQQLYNGSADRDLFKSSIQKTALTFVYNGDVNTADDEAFSYGCSVMCGRGLIRNPALLRIVRGGNAAERSELIAFHDRLLEGYKEYMQGDVPTLHHMKEFWFYYSTMFDCSPERMKKALRANRLSDYLSAVYGVMNNCDIKEK